MRLISGLLTLYWYVILARVLMSWFSPSPSHPVVRAIYAVTEPVLGPVRRVLPPMGGFDLSPVVIFLVLMYLQRLF